MIDLDLKYRPVALIILDGWGVPDDPEVSAEAKAHTPFYDSLIINYPNTTIKCSGEDVGLPEGQMGNSEVGHLNIGAGRIVYQDFTRINRAVRLGELETNPVLVDAMEKARDTDGTLHLMGLLSDGGVHSDISHVYALLKMAAGRGLKDIRIHAFMDGRDTPPASGLGYMEDLQGFIEKTGIGNKARVGTVSGRFFAMDRDNRWDRVKKAYDAIVSGEGQRFESALDAIGSAYDNGETDEFIIPSITEDYGGMQDGDSVIFFNFRTDRTRELTRAIALDGFDGFERPVKPRLSSFVCMTEYDKMFNLPAAFPPQRLDNILGEVISGLGLRQLRIAETEKYAHVTFFFNGGRETPFDGEERSLIPSPKDVATYDLKPQMSAFEVTDEAVKRLRSGTYDVIIMNYANPDMVGHTGIMDAAVKACEAVDLCLSRVISEILGAGGIAFITADHGNAEKMIDLVTGGPFTAHTSSEVPFIATDKGLKLRSGGILADIAPTILDIMGIDKPKEMTGESLVIK